MAKESKFSDVLLDSKNQNDFLWILKDYESNIPYFTNYKNKEFLKSVILKSTDFKFDISIISDTTGKLKEELIQEAEVILDGMCHNIGMSSVRVMGVILRRLMRSIYDAVLVETKGLHMLREAHKRGRVVLLPTHRSYADFLIVSYLMFHFDLPLPVTAAAMDFMGMKFVGELLRRCGAFFIRRSFATDLLYWAVFSRYVKTLLQIAQEPMQFFIEGTRSRTNKALSPRAGLLGIVLEAWLSGQAGEDVLLVPVAISYDRILEEGLYASELLGVPKPRESTRGLLKVHSALTRSYGSVRVSFAEPISLATVAAAAMVTRPSHGLQLRQRPSLFEHEKRLLHSMAREVVHTQQQILELPDTSLVAMVTLAGRHGNHDSMRLRDGVAWLLRFLPAALVSSPLHQSLEGRVNRALSLLGFLNSHSSMETELQLANYRNPVLFHLARESVLALVRANAGLSTETEIRRCFCAVLTMLSREFIFCSSAQESYEIAQTNLDRAATLVQPGSPDWVLEIVHCAVQPHICAYLLYSAMLQSSSTGQSAATVPAVQSAALQVVRANGKLLSAETASIDMVRNYMATCAHTRKTNLKSPGPSVPWMMQQMELCLSPPMRSQIRLLAASVTLANPP